MVGRRDRNRKVQTALELYPNHFRKDQNKWWCGYRGQEVVAIEEASPKTMEHLASRLKQWPIDIRSTERSKVAK